MHLQTHASRKDGEEILSNIASGVSAQTGEAFFQSLVQYLTKALNVEYALVGELIEPGSDRLRTVAVYGDGQLMENFDYDLAHTPCENVVGQQLCVYPRGIQQLFPLDATLKEMGAEGYMGTPLFDSVGGAFGLLAVVSRKPLPDIPLTEEVLTIFATRASSELERIQSIEQEQAARHRIANILESITDGFFALDHEWRFTYLNRQAESWLERPQQDLLGKCVWEEFPEAVGSAFYQAYHRAVSEQVSVEFEAFYPPLDTWFSVHAYPGTDGLSVYFKNINERKQAEEERQRQKQRSQLLADLTRKVRRSLDVEKVLQTTVAEVQNLLQCDRVLIYQLFPDGTGKVTSEMVLPEYPKIQGTSFSQEVFPQEYRALYAQGRVKGIADVHAPDTGMSPCCVEFANRWAIKAKLIVPILQTPNSQSPTQNHLWGLLIAHQCDRPRQWESFEIDLLEQLGDQMGVALHQAELLNHLEELVEKRTARLRAANRKLESEISDRQQAEEQLRLTTDALPALISYLDSQLRYRFANQAYEDWFGKPPTQIVGSRIQEVFGESVDQQVREHLEAALSGQRVTYEKEFRFSDGTLHSLDITHIPHFGEQGEVKGLFNLANDISDRKAVERMKSEFVSVVSHELRTPLTSIRGGLQLLSSGQLGNLSESGQEMLEISLKNTNRLVRLIDDVLDLERIESGRVVMDRQTCDAAELLEQAAEGMQAMAQQQGVTLSLSPVAITLWADPDHILQTLTNLLSNAIKFSPPESTVWLAAESQGQEVLFQVTDQGQGIPANKLESIFERFQQVDASDSRKKGSTGLGLSICRQIIQQHGGRIWAESIPGEGSTFYFTLPVERGQQKD